MTYSPCPNCHKLNRITREGIPVCGACKSDLHLRDGINELSASELQLLVEKSPLPVLTDFWAPWCGPCRLFAPVFKEAAKALDGQVVLAKVNTEEHPQASRTYRVQGIPTVVLFRNGLERGRHSGVVPLPKLLEWVRTV
jgi:thioredoxin 2